MEEEFAEKLSKGKEETTQNKQGEEMSLNVSTDNARRNESMIGPGIDNLQVMVEFPSLEILKTHLDKVLCNLL